MNNINRIKILILALLPLAILCCQPKKNTCVAGSGGAVTIVAFPKHHGKQVRPYKAYVKYNSKDAPAALPNYDLVLSADTTEDHIHITNMKCGDYYIYMTGYDTSISAPVTGGIPYTLPASATGEVDLDVPVTE